MSPDIPLRSAADELASRSDAEIVDLLLARPDLASPPPRGTGVLAQRALSASSIALAGERLDLLAIAVLEAFLETAARDVPHHELLGPVARDEIVGRLGRRALRADVDARLALLSDLALIWPATMTGRKAASWQAGIHLPAAMPWRAAHLIGPVATLSGDELSALIATFTGRPSDLLTTLARGPGLGSSRDAAPGADPQAPVPRLIAAGLLARVDEQTVELPPQVGQLLRDEPPLETAQLRAPTLSAPVSTPVSPAGIDAAGGGEALELLRHATALIDALGSTPAAVLKSGGIGIRELRRLARLTELSVTRVGFLIELLAAARLVSAGIPDQLDSLTVDEVLAPTTTVDAWLHHVPERRWSTLAIGWLAVPRSPWRIGETDRDGAIIGALSAETYDAAASLQRRTILAPLAELPDGTPAAIDSLIATLGWRHPRQLRRLSSTVVSQTIREATELGLVAHGAITAAGRALLAADLDTEDDATIVAAMATSLPEPIDYFLVQADFTVTVPGPLTADLADRLALVADLESGGMASVYRISEDSIRRALDTGQTATELSSLFTEHSKTPVPQSLGYLIDDVARRHGSLRVGVASSFIRCHDATMMTEVLRSDAAADLALRALAPTVAVSGAPLRTVIDRLRSAGFAPAGEDSSGALVDLRPAGVRVPARTRTTIREGRRKTLGTGQALAVVTRMRTADRADGAGPASSVAASGGGETTSALIQLALKTGRRLRLGYVDAHGSASRHVVRARSLAAGQLIADEEIGESDLHFSLHRITRVELL